ncbi:uncharacterized protein LOC130663927 [Microplitis mediator]|uniref:uncharacterized protein LOC130663927 n=1 Tax=Microplitis mediator TaxID=375433 RepID=UPI00255473EE|nr:uncharacterized protein LOC130663927 [Microplitis mediator]
MNKLSGTMKAEERIENSTNELTKKTSNEQKLDLSIIIKHLLFVSFMEVFLMLVVYWMKSDDEEAYSMYGLILGFSMSVTFSAIPYSPCAGLEDWKYRRKYFSLLGMREILMIALSLLSLYMFFYIDDEDIIRACEWECPLRQLIYCATFSLVFISAGFDVLFWVFSKFKIIKKLIIFLMSIIPDNSPICPQCQNKISTSSIKVQ